TEVALGGERRPNPVAVQLVEMVIGIAGPRLNQLLNLGRHFDFFVLRPSGRWRHRPRLLIVGAPLLIWLRFLAGSPRLTRAAGPRSRSAGRLFFLSRTTSQKLNQLFLRVNAGQTHVRRVLLAIVLEDQRRKS